MSVLPLPLLPAADKAGMSGAGGQPGLSSIDGARVDGARLVGAGTRTKRAHLSVDTDEHLWRVLEERLACTTQGRSARPKAAGRPGLALRLRCAFWGLVGRTPVRNSGRVPRAL